MISQDYSAHLDYLSTAWGSALVEEGYDAAVVHSGSSSLKFLDDSPYPFVANPLFLSWLPLVYSENCVLIIQPGQQPVLYFYQLQDFWHQAPSNPEEWWAQHYQLRQVTSVDAWRDAIPAGRIAYLGDAPAIADKDELNPAGLISKLHLARTRKTAYEIACLAEAQRIAVKAHSQAAKAFEQGLSEFEIDQQYLAACQLEEMECPYRNIVAINHHSAVLHYQIRDRSTPSERLSFLIDAGARCQGYSADITRSYAAKAGLYADLVAALDEAQLSLVNKIVAGQSYPELHFLAHRKLAHLLKDHDIIYAGADSAVASGLTSVFLPHGLGHFLGLQVHDVAGQVGNDGNHLAPPEGHSYLRLNRMLEPGNVLTVEPGLYFIPSLLEGARTNSHQNDINWPLIEQLLPYGGIRIEDNILVTQNEPINLTREAFSATGNNND